MAIAVESIASKNYDTSNDNSITISKPSGLQSGDLLVAVIGLIATVGQNVNTATGWTSAGNGLRSDSRLSMQYKIADSSDASATDFTFNFDSTGDGDFGLIYRISGVAPNKNLDASDTNEIINTSSVNLSTSITPSFSDSLIITSYMGQGTGATSASNYFLTPSITFTEDFDNSANDGTFDPILASAHGIKSNTTEITAYGVDFTVNKDGIGIIAVFTAQADATGTHDHIAVTPTVNSGDETSGIHVTAPTFTVSPTINSPTATGTAPTNWTNQNKNSATWTNQNKS